MTVAFPKSVERSLAISCAAPGGGSGSSGSRDGSLGETIGRVVQALEDSRVSWVLVGAHAVGIYTEPRATADFDFVVEARELPRVLDLLEKRLGDLGRDDRGPSVQLRNLDVDLIRSNTHSLFQEALRHTRQDGEWRVPVPEVLMALKFLSAVSPWRGAAKRTYDIGDLRALYQAVGGDNLDRELLMRLAATVYPGAETEFEAILGRIERGEPLSI